MVWFDMIYPGIIWGKPTRKKLTMYENNIEFQNVFCNLVNLALDQFDFDNLPETCNNLYLKKTLVFTGRAAIINDNELGYLSLGISNEAQNFTLYGLWDRINAYGANGFNRSYSCYVEGSDNTGAQAVICRENPMCYPLIYYIISFAERISNALRTADVTARKLKTPYFISVDEPQVSTVKEALSKIELNEDVVIGNKTTNPDIFKVLPTNIREGALTTLWSHYYNLYNEVRVLLGIPGVPNRNKAERMITDEAEADDNLAASNLSYRKHCYEEFCETVNNHFGLNISVRFNRNDDVDVWGEDETELSDDIRGGDLELSEE